MAMKQWPTIMAAEAQARHLWDSYGSPGIWKILDGKCDLRHCVLKAQVPRLNPRLKFPVVQLAGIGTILYNTRILPMGS